MKEQLEDIRRQAQAELSAASTKQELETLRVKYLGKKGELTAILKQMGKLSPEERPIIGQLANEVRESITALLESSQAEIKQKERNAKLASEKLDVTLPSATSIRFR